MGVRHMTDAHGSVSGLRRVPTQARGRRRVDDILDATARVVVQEGVGEITTRSIAREAGCPVPTVYQYFADKEAVLLEMIARDLADMLQEMLAALRDAGDLSVNDLVEHGFWDCIRAYERRPALVEVWLRGRANPRIYAVGRERNREFAQAILAMGIAQGLCRPDLPDAVITVAVECGDRILQLAFADSYQPDRALLEQYVEMMTGYLSPWLLNPKS